MRRIALLFCVLFACNTDTFTGDDGGADAPIDNVVGGGDGSMDGFADAAAPRFCETVDAQFCSDFDIPGDAGAGFILPPFSTDGYTLSFSTARAKSKPTAVEVVVPNDAGGVARLSTGVGSFDAGASTNATLDLDIFIPDFPAVTTQPLFFFTFGVVAPNFEFGLTRDGLLWKLQTAQTKVGPVVTGNIATNEWVHVNVVIAISNTAGAVGLTVTSSAGTATAAMTPGQSATAPSSGTQFPVLLDLGVFSSTPPPSIDRIYYDNVVIRTQ